MLTHFAQGRQRARACPRHDRRSLGGKAALRREADEGSGALPNAVMRRSADRDARAPTTLNSGRGPFGQQRLSPILLVQSLSNTRVDKTNNGSVQ
jgi:hypothetical protein